MKVAAGFADALVLELALRLDGTEVDTLAQAGVQMVYIPPAVIWAMAVGLATAVCFPLLAILLRELAPVEQVVAAHLHRYI